MSPSLFVRCERSVNGEIVTRIFENAKCFGTVELQVGEDTVARCSVLRDLKHVLGEAPLPHVDPQSFRLWIRGEYDGRAVFTTALGALQIAIFLGDDRQEEWAQIAGTLLFSCLAKHVKASGAPTDVVNLVESLGDDVHAKLLSAAPLDCILAHFSRESHARAIQLRTHYDDDGAHFIIEVSERFSAVHASALIAALNSLPSAEQHVSVTVRPSWNAFSPGKTPRLQPTLSTQASAAWGTPFVTAERWLSAVTAVAESLKAMPRLRHLFCICCSLDAAAASSLPLSSVATLHLRENNIGTVSFSETEKRKPLFDKFVRRLVTPDVTKLPYNTTIQELDLSSNNLGNSMVPSFSSEYTAWNRDLMLALNRMPNLMRLDLSDNNLSVADLIHLLQPPVANDTSLAVPPDAGPPEDGARPPVDEWLSRQVSSPSLPKLEALNVSKNELCGALHGFLERLTRLTRLDVSDTTLRAESAVYLADVLSRMTGMRWLNLAGNRITARAAAPLGAAVARMPGLEYLNASGHVLFNFGPDGVRALAPQLATLTALEHLDLSKQGMGAAGAQATAEAVVRMPKLTCLELSGNNIQQEGACALRPALEGLSELVALGLADNGLRDAAVAAVARGVMRLPELRRVKLDGNPMAKWSCDWGKGFVGKDVLSRWLEPDLASCA